MEELTKRIAALLAHKPNAVIGIDGCCASGKTTLASLLSEKFYAQVIHMDDFFLPPEMRTEKRFLEAGGNIHYERFLSEVAVEIKNGSDFDYGVFSCKEMRIIGENTVSADKPIIIEGAYALHPCFGDIYDLKVFVTVSPETQLKRIAARNGANALDAFTSKWIPFENKYFSAFGISDKCDIIINNK